MPDVPDEPAGPAGEAPRLPENPLLAWCRHLEARLAGSGAQDEELVAENERLRGQVAELSAALKSIQNAYVLGKLRAAGKLPAELTRRAPAARSPDQPITEVTEGPPEPGRTGRESTRVFRIDETEEGDEAEP